MISNILEIDESFIDSEGVFIPAIHVLKDSMYNTQIKYEFKEEQPYTLIFKMEKRDFDSIKHLLGNDIAIFIYDDLNDFNTNNSNKKPFVKKLKKHHINIS